MMTTKTLLLTTLTCLTLVGCGGTMSRGDRAVIGGAMGLGAGAAITGSVGGALAGTAIGAGLGALTK